MTYIFAGPESLAPVNTWSHSICFPRPDAVTMGNTRREFQEGFCIYCPFGLKITHSGENSNTFHRAGSDHSEAKQ